MVRLVPVAFAASCCVLAFGFLSLEWRGGPAQVITTTPDSGGTTSTQPAPETTTITTSASNQYPAITPTTTSPNTKTELLNTTTATQPQYVACPLHPTSAQTLVDFTAQGSVPLATLALRANGTIDDATYGPHTAPLGVGLYKLWLASYAPGDSSSQYDRQSWYLVAEDTVHAIVAKSEPTPDIPSGITMYTDTLARSILITRQVSAVSVRHAAYSTALGHYVVPLCALFERVPDTPTATNTTTVAPVTGQATTTPTTSTNESTIYDAPATQEATLVEETTLPEVPSCPFSARTDRTIVSFTMTGDHTAIVANGTSDAARRYRAVKLPAGTYSVRLASYDGGVHDTDGQMWYVVAHTSSGVLAKTPPSTDIPAWEYGAFTSKVTDAFAMDHDSVAIEAVHARFPGNMPHTVVPVCAAFDRVAVPDSVAIEARDVPTANVSPTTSILPASPTVLPQTEKQDPGVGTVVHVAAPPPPSPAPSTPRPASVSAKDTSVLVSPEAVGIASNLKTIAVQPEVLAVRRQAIAQFSETPFTLLQAGSMTERESVVRRLLDQASSSPATSSNPIALTRVVASEAGSSTPTKTALATNVLRERTGLTAVRDTDGDGVSDYDEERLYGSDPENPFTAGSILSDGERILLGLDPLSADLTPVVTESPRSSGELFEKLAIIESVHLSTTSASTTPEEPAREHVYIKGYTKPLAYVTLYLYSTPIVVTVRADAGGTFEYEFDETLENGSHELYVASINNAGKVLAKSEPIPFVKTAQAIEYTSPYAARPPSNPVDGAARTMATLGLFALVFAGLITLVWIGMHRSRSNTDEPHENT